MTNLKSNKLKTVQFLGTRNKTDLLMYLSHMLSNLEKRVLLVDCTKNQHYHYGFARLPEGNHLYDFLGIDILVNIDNWLQIEERLKEAGESTVGYDVILLDMDSTDVLHGEWPEFDERFYVGDFDRSHQLRDAEIIRTLFKTTDNKELKRITFESTYSMNPDNFDSVFQEVEWRSMNYLIEPDDKKEELLFVMQHDMTIPFKRLNKQYKELLTEIVSAMYEMHVKDVADAVKPSLFKLPFKRNRGAQLESSNA